MEQIRMSADGDSVAGMVEPSSGTGIVRGARGP